MVTLETVPFVLESTKNWKIQPLKELMVSMVRQAEAKRKSILETLLRVKELLGVRKQTLPSPKAKASIARPVSFLTKISMVLFITSLKIFVFPTSPHETPDLNSLTPNYLSPSAICSIRYQRHLRNRRKEHPSNAGVMSGGVSPAGCPSHGCLSARLENCGP